ncbi:hypothetical protein NAL32_01395 [Chryseobacterium sp. Ch-15]|nr:hypothetical protein [Chryseobacterium muglaense]MCM2553039.1 hypothetical protein [Chryseobacterium muglaense]
MSKNLNYLNPTDFNHLSYKAEEIAKMLNSLITKLQTNS